MVALGASPAGAQRGGPVLHEPIPADPRDDIAMQVSTLGDLPAAIETKSGMVTAPDARNVRAARAGGIARNGTLTSPQSGLW